MNTSGRREPAHQTTGSDPAVDASTATSRAEGPTAPNPAWSARRIVLLAAIALVAIPFLIALWMLVAGASSAPGSDGRGATLLLSAFTMLATGIVLLGLTPWVFSKDVRIRTVVIATSVYLLMALGVGLTLSIAPGTPSG